MNSPILTSVARFLLPVFVTFSVFLLWRGHNAPGGGFTGGLVASAGFALHALAYGPDRVRRALRVELRSLMGVGLGIALLAAILGLLGGSFFRAIWIHVGATHLGTPLLFDIGVYVIVVAVVLTILLIRAEDHA